ncbi:hypothetical protein HYFRA_00013568 [Hymenoscyphus fraxineus]|uniref:Uncharacterized protein n=1 Tax=Hymenoscyphus fraxineus TaxID=746836 RepID=A0A9N9L893_9HELO|nr:hypothetical protein HYFRA_00013568 [Hymenoscyphus fraxineus]
MAWSAIRAPPSPMLPPDPEIRYGPENANHLGQEDLLKHVDIDMNMHVSTVGEFLESAGVPRWKMEGVWEEQEEKEEWEEQEHWKEWLKGVLLVGANTSGIGIFILEVIFGTRYGYQIWSL